MPEISQHAIVSEGAQLAPDVSVGPFSYIGPEVRIAEGCRIENNVTVTGRTTLGAGTHVFPMAVVGVSADMAESTGLCEIGEANGIREHVTIYAGSDEQPTRVGRGNLVMIESTLGPGSTLGDHCVLANCTQIGPGAIVEDYVRMSAFTQIDPGVRVGAYTFSAAYVGVDRDAPPYAMIQGFPFRVRGVNTHNLKACGFGTDDIRELKAAFREVFNGGVIDGQADAVQRLADGGSPNEMVQQLVAFLKRATVEETG